MPDKGARTNIFKAALRKSPVMEDVYMDFLADYTKDFSGADITELC